jgi:uncharacterized protein (TIGR02301 family)
MRPLFAVLAPVLVLVALAAPAAAQSPAQGQSLAQGETLTKLAEVLGQSHALRQACAGPGDQYWRARMMRLMDLERPKGSLEGELKAAFNDGYASRRRMFPVCTPATRRAEMTAAARGRAIAQALAQGTRGDFTDAAPEPMAQEAPPR